MTSRSREYDRAMSTLAADPLDELEALDETRAIHLYDLTVLVPYTFCGEESWHSCFDDQRWEPSMTHCPECKRPVCTICALLGERHDMACPGDQNLGPVGVALRSR